ncbi:hypothetical protein EG68_11787 [Paragonimus skrjabini miyazakii]|uniref:Uncharacterized protein n=1 Tax=Paragonimus skrjabini miyazakii TaxID=59628 RepID=A0A8S9YPL7_9TREM|nr:hypothetical protein EG68_11787 [Paragonimus skrjabini miyazakii]
MASETEPLAMLEVFQECQLNSLSHVRLCVRLKNIFLKSRFSHFCDEFFELCRYSLVSMERTPFRERTIDFIVKFALFCGKSEDDGEPTDTLNNRLLLKLFLFCMKVSFVNSNLWLVPCFTAFAHLPNGSCHISPVGR